MKSKNKGGEFIIFGALPFKHKQLSLHKQREDKDIKNKRDELLNKRKQNEQIKLKCRQQEQNFKQYEKLRKNQHAILVKQQQKLRNDLFRLSIRRDQIHSHINFGITVQKSIIIKQYLKCLPYTAGRQYESIQFCQSEQKYHFIKFFFQFTIDRFFGRTQTQRKIIGNLSRIVFCKKLLFQGNWIIVCVKQPVEFCYTFRNKTSKKSNKSIYHPEKGKKTFDLEIYAITGKYFALKRQYTEDQLILEGGVQAFNKINKSYNRRLSVADNIAKLNALRLLCNEIQIDQKLQRQNGNTVSEFYKTIKTVFCQNETNQQLSKLSHVDSYQQNTSEIIKKQSSNGEQSHANTKTENHLELNEQSQSDYQKVSKTKKSFGKSLLVSTQICKFNTNFLAGAEQFIFPKSSPLLNLVILKEKKELFLLREYIKSEYKKPILEKAIARFKLKMQIKVEMKKCFLSKVINISRFFETAVGEEKEAITMPFLFILKHKDTANAHEVYLSCSSLYSHPRIQNAVNINHLFHRQVVQKIEVKQANLIKNSNAKNKKNKQNTKKKISIHKDKNMIEHQKSGFMQEAKKNQWSAFTPQISQKFTSFLQNYLISFRQAKFIPEQEVTIRIGIIIKIQNRMRCFLSKKKLASAKEFIKKKCDWNEISKILITAILWMKQGLIKVYVEDTSNGKHPLKVYQFNSEYWQIICSTMDKFHSQQGLQCLSQKLFIELQQNIQIDIKQKIQKQKERPQKNRKIIKKYLFKMYLRTKVHKNIYYIKKVIVRDKCFVLIIRRDRHVKSLLQCHLFDIVIRRNKDVFIQQSRIRKIGSEYGSHRSENHLNPRTWFEDTPYKYQKIHLMEKYFQNIDPKLIIDEFFIQKGIFLLKPARQSNIYYIDRLSYIDINSQQFAREFSNLSQYYNQIKKNNLEQKSNIIEQNGISNKSFYKLPIKNKNDQVLLQNKDVVKILTIITNPAKKNLTRKGEKKISIDHMKENQLINIKNSVFKDHKVYRVSKTSLGQTSSKISRQLFKLLGNSHESLVYYSFYKQDNIFFELKFYSIFKQQRQNAYSQVLFNFNKQRLYKSQLQQNNILVKKLAKWVCENQNCLTQIKKNNQNYDTTSFKNQSNSFINLEFFNALLAVDTKRFSYQAQKKTNNEKGARTNTLTF